MHLGCQGGHFELPIDPKGQLGDLSLNKSQAYTILASPEDFHGNHYKHILDNVCIELTVYFCLIGKYHYCLIENTFEY